MLSAPYAGAVGARELIVEAIRDHGPIRFDRYMELALYGEGGFYEEPPVGAAGDFVTSPHVHPVFAELLARAPETARWRASSWSFSPRSRSPTRRWSGAPAPERS